MDFGTLSGFRPMRTKTRQNEIPTERIPIRTNIQNIAHYCDSSVKGSKTSVLLLMNVFVHGLKLNSVNPISDKSPETRRPIRGRI